MLVPASGPATEFALAFALLKRRAPGRLLFRKEPVMPHAWLRFTSAAALLAALALVSSAAAQQEIAPPQGKGRVVVFVSGMGGPSHDKGLIDDIAALGYDVVVFDGRKFGEGMGQALRDDIQQAQQTPHALAGKVALVGVSFGGGFALAHGVRWADLVAVEIVWYPATRFALKMPDFVGRIRVPVLMFAGESDKFQNCCLIGTARSLAADAAVVKAPFELVTYPGADHDFIRGGRNHNPAAYQDALARTAARLKAAFAD